jgi:hypothetical protein
MRRKLHAAVRRAVSSSREPGRRPWYRVRSTWVAVTGADRLQHLLSRSGRVRALTLLPSRRAPDPAVKCR